MATTGRLTRRRRDHRASLAVAGVMVCLAGVAGVVPAPVGADGLTEIYTLAAGEGRVIAAIAEWLGPDDITPQLVTTPPKR